jgi:hypothetical protein
MLSLPRHKSDAPWSWQDYVRWPDEERWEIIDGTAYAISPAPSTKHQKVALRLSAHLLQQLTGKPDFDTAKSHAPREAAWRKAFGDMAEIGVYLGGEGA